MSPPEHFRFLRQFYGHGFPGTRYQTLIPRVSSIHLPYETWVIYNSNIDSQVKKSTKVSLILVHARHVRPFPIDIKHDFTGDSSQMFKNIGINKWKDQGNLPLKCIYGKILWNLISFFYQSWIRKKMMVVLVFLRRHCSNNSILYWPTIIYKGVHMMSLFNIVHIMLEPYRFAYLSFCLHMEMLLHHSNLNIVYIWATKNNNKIK